MKVAEHHIATRIAHAGPVAAAQADAVALAQRTQAWTEETRARLFTI